MFKMLLLLVLTAPLSTLALAQTQAQAQGSGQTKTFCAVKSFIGIEIRNSAEFKALTCGDLVSTFETAFQKVQNISPVDLSETLLVIYNQELPKGSRYSWVTSTVTMDVADLSLLEKQVSVFYHEIGHKIYFEALAATVPEIAERRVGLNDYVAQLKVCAKAGSFVGCPPTEVMGDLVALNQAFSADFRKFLYIDTPYNELFADVVAALAAEDPNAIAKTMSECSMSDPACEYRAFSKNTIDKFAGENTHSRFASIRRDLWEGWVGPRLANKSQLLTDLAALFVSESFSNWEADYALIEGMSALKQIKRLRVLLDLKVTESPTLKYAL